MMWIENLRIRDEKLRRKCIHQTDRGVRVQRKKEARHPPPMVISPRMAIAKEFMMQPMHNPDKSAALGASGKACVLTSSLPTSSLA